ncbi:hypothetical protein [Cupriavidus respiraculi]|uniref:hypothetical protein n=1 Tax=Cupriavidus respiraculi TaxID=195930 RepID=UPI001CC79C48|nr:hypothetical protein [Cupriavidus respiraculi]
MLNQYTYGLWAMAAAGREVIHILGWAKGDPASISIASHLPASNGGAMVSGVFAVLEAAGTAHLVWKEKKKKSEIDRALREHADGHERFIAGNPGIASLLGERHALTSLLQTWPRDDSGGRIAEWQRDSIVPMFNLQRVEADLKDVGSKLEKLALELADNFEHYVLYEKAANQLTESNDNIRALGIAVARDCVVQLGGTACNATDTATKLGAHGVDLVANGIASGAFGIAMGALHVGAGIVGWYQSERRLQDLKVVRNLRSDLRTSQGRDAHVQHAIVTHRQWLIDEAAQTQCADVRNVHTANAAATMSAEAAGDVAAAKQLVEVLTHHQAKAFQSIESTELKKNSRAKQRVAYGTVSIVMGAGAIVAATVASGGIFALVLSAVAFGLGFYWLGSAFLRFLMDRIEENLVARRDTQQKIEAERILKESRRPTIHEMRRNKFVAIDGMLMALIDGERPITRCALADALISLGMDRNLVEALRLRSTVRLDGTYAQDREDILKKLRCFVAHSQTDALKAAIGGTTLRNDEAMLKSLRQLFQEFIEGRTAMRQQYERRTGALAFLAQRFREWLPGKCIVSEQQRVESPAPFAPPSEAQTRAAAPI